MLTTRLPAATIFVLAALMALAAGVARGSADLPTTASPHLLGAPDAAAQELYLQGCASCHGADGRGSDTWPSLIGVGAAAVDFQLSTGRMPFAGQPGAQAIRKPVAYSEEKITQLVAYVVALGRDAPPGPAIPTVRTDPELLARGHEIFIGNCAPCHGATAQGGAVGGGALAPALDKATSVQVGEAMLVGPGQMPVFALPQTDIDAVATYVDFLQTAPAPGGFSIGGIGPVPEGFVAWVLGAGLLLVIAYLIGREWDRA